MHNSLKLLLASMSTVSTCLAQPLIFRDDFSGSSAAWIPHMEYLGQDWIGGVLSGELVVQDIVPTQTFGCRDQFISEMAHVVFERQICPLADFDVTAEIRWDQDLGNVTGGYCFLELVTRDELSREHNASAGFADGWIRTWSDAGSFYTTVDGNWTNGWVYGYDSGPGSVAYAGSMIVRLRRVGTSIEAMWNDQTRLVGTMGTPVLAVRLRFIKLTIACDGGIYFEPLSVNYVELRGEPARPSRPADRTTCPTNPAVFKSIPPGNGPFEYQWQRLEGSTWTDLAEGENSTNNGNGGTFAATGTATDTLTVGGWLDDPEDIPLPLEHQFRCIVTNTCGSIESSAATLTLCPVDFNCDGFVSGADFDQFVQAFEKGNLHADYDGDGFITGLDFDLYVQTFEAGC